MLEILLENRKLILGLLAIIVLGLIIYMRVIKNNEIFEETVVPKNVSKKMLPGEKVLFTGGYNRNDAVIQNNGTITTFILTSKVSINPNGDNVLGIFNTVFLNDRPGINNFVNETYTITSSDTKSNQPNLGQIQWSGLYNNGQRTTVTDTNVQRFMVTGSYGIYNKVTGVLIDYKSDLNTRTIYFISK